MPHPADALRQEMEERKSNVKGTEKTEKPADTKEVKVAKTQKKATKEKATKKAASKAAKPAKKPVRIAKKGGKKAAPAKSKKASTKKAAPKKSAPKKAPAKKKSASKANGKSNGAAARTFDRAKDGDGLRPIERKVVNAVAKNSEPTSIVGLAHRMFGKDCPAEGENSVRTIRNAVRIPVKYGILESAGRGTIKVTTAYKRADGDTGKLAERYRNRQAKAAKSASA